MLFLNYTVKMYDPVLVGLQSEAPKVHVLRKTLIRLIKSVQVRFLKPSAMASGAPEDVDFKSTYNLKADKDLIIGESAEAFIADADKNALRPHRVKQFYCDVKKYFTAVCSYLVEKLQINDPLLLHAEVVDVAIQQSAQRSDLAWFVDRFPALIPPGSSRDIVMEQFASYQCTDIGCIADRIDETWAAVSKLKDEEGETHLKELSLAMLGILTVPHSNSHCERIFSTVTKNRTDQRASLGDDTLEALLVVKAQPGQLFEHEHPPKMLHKLRSAYYEANK